MLGGGVAMIGMALAFLHVLHIYYPIAWRDSPLAEIRFMSCDLTRWRGCGLSQ